MNVKCERDSYLKWVKVQWPVVLNNISKESLFVAQVVVVLKSIVKFETLFLLLQILKVLTLLPLSPYEVATLMRTLIITFFILKAFLVASGPPDSSLYNVANEIEVVSFPNVVI